MPNLNVLPAPIIAHCVRMVAVLLVILDSIPGEKTKLAKYVIPHVPNATLQ